MDKLSSESIVPKSFLFGALVVYQLQLNDCPCSASETIKADLNVLVTLKDEEVPFLQYCDIMNTSSLEKTCLMALVKAWSGSEEAVPACLFDTAMTCLQ